MATSCIVKPRDHICVYALGQPCSVGEDHGCVELTSAVIVYLAPRIRSGCDGWTSSSARVTRACAPKAATHCHVVARAAEGARHAVDELARDTEIT